MPRFRHPRALDDVAGHPPSRVSLPGRGARADVTDGTFTADEDTARTLAAAFGVSVATLRVDDDADTDDESAETCTVVKADGEVCGRERPCGYHD